nr:putative ribonuclease H-like domain-containing protein [Tanacetum cinerariifolium]
MDIIEFYGSKEIKMEYSNAKTPQQNRVAERKNRTLSEAARTMLADSFLPNIFSAEVVSTACYVFNRVLVTKPQNKTPYELLTGKIPFISYIRPFGCHVTILNTIDNLCKFEEKSDEGFLVGCSLSSKAFRPITAENKANKTAGIKEANTSAGTQDNLDAGNSKMEADHAQEYYVLSLWSSYTSTVKSSKAKNRDEKLNEDTDSKTNKEPVALEEQAFLEELERLKRQEKRLMMQLKLLERLNVASTPLKTASTPSNQDDSHIPSLEDIFEVLRYEIFTSASYDDEGAMVDFINLETNVHVSPILTSRIHSIHSTTQILGDPTSAVQTKRKVNKSSEAYAFSWCDEFEALMKYMFQMSSMGELTFFLRLQVKQKEDGIFVSHDKYVAEILKKFDFLSVKTASTPIETKKPLVKDEEAVDVDVHLYRFMIGSLMRLISWQCKKQTIVANSTTEAEYVVVANCCGQVLWIQKQLLDYGFNFMNIKIYIDNESTICRVKNPVFHSKTKHIEIRHHFIRDAFEKKLIQVLKIHTDDNVADLLTKAFDVSSLGDEHVSKQGEDKKAKTGLNIEEGNFNRVADLVGEGADYAVNKESATNKIKVLNSKAEGVSDAGETLSIATLAVNTISV